jgi:prepilin-type N-terminal cleavage/methylation domain-containing protein
MLTENSEPIPLMRYTVDKMRRLARADGGFTLVELLITVLLLGTVAASMLTLFVTLVHSAVVAKRQAVASTLATNQMEYLKSLPYNSLAVAGGSIYTTNPLPASTSSTLNGVKYTVKTSISYVDDAFDGCGSYPTQTLKQTYCRNYPPPTGAPATDTNPADYKILAVSVSDPRGGNLANLNTQVSARVSETASTTGALFVSIIDATGNPVSGATASVSNTTVTPNVSVSDTTDSNGVAIFYGLPPDTTGYDYQITGSKTDYSTLVTIKPNGSLQPTYSSQNILTQSSSYVTLTIKPTTANSLLVETTDTSGNPLGSVKVYAKGGYKNYTATSDTTYCFDNMTTTSLSSCLATTGSDTRPTTDPSTGLATISNLVPGNYIFCGDAGATNCKVGTTTYYLAAAVPYGGNNSFNPIAVPTYVASTPPTTTYPYGGNNYLQKVRLMLTTSSTFPRVATMTPDDVSLTGAPSSFAFVITGTNLPCSATAASCSTAVKFVQGSTNYVASCTGASTGVQLSCTVNVAAATAGSPLTLVVTANSQTLTIPASLPLGGLNVTP